MEDDDNIAEDLFGSVISLESLEDTSPIQEKAKRGKKKPRTDQSPYSSHQFPGSGHSKSVGRGTGHEAWSSAIRNGFTGLSSENSPSNRWAQSRAITKRNKVPSYDRNGTKSLNGPFSRDEHILASGKPAYKSPEDYYDEVMELRQVIKEIKNDNGVLKTKLQRLTQENVLKDRQIKDFLNPNKQPDEIRRTLTDRKADSSAVVSSLKQKLHLMERNVKEKENELRKLKSDLKSTNTEELKIQLETYYEETQRLQTVLSSVYSQAPGTRTLPDASSSRGSSRINSPRREVLGELDQGRLEKILDENRRLESENKGLKKDLLSAIERPQNGEKTSKSQNIDYADMNRLQMLKKIGELEQLLEDSEAKSKASFKNNKENQNKNSRPDWDKDSSEVEKQGLTIENLKKDRAHYREENEKLRMELKETYSEIEKLTEKVPELNEGKVLKDSSPPSAPRPLPRQRSKSGSISSTKKSISFQTHSKFEKDEEQAAKTLQKHWRRYNNKKTSKQDDDYSKDVVEIQSILRAHLNRKRRIEQLKETRGENVEQEDDLEWEDALIRIQSALRAHHSRRKYYFNTERRSSQGKHRVNSESDDSGASSDDRSEARTRFERRSFSKSNQQNSPPRKSSTSRIMSKLAKKDEDSDDDDDDDDDVVIGGSRRNLREGKRNGIRTHGEPTSRKSSAANHRNGFNNSGGINKNFENSEDDVQISTRFGKPFSSSKSGKSKNEFSFANSTEKKDDGKKSTFFGQEKRSTLDENLRQKGTESKDSLDSLFSPSRPMKLPFDHRAGSEEDSDDGLVTTAKKSSEVTVNKTKKSLFSWAGSKTKKSQDAAPSPRQRTSSKTKKNENSKPPNVWSSRPSETIDDDDDDVVVTPKINRRNPTKTASLLDELF